MRESLVLTPQPVDAGKSKSIQPVKDVENETQRILIDSFLGDAYGAAKLFAQELKERSNFSLEGLPSLRFFQEWYDPSKIFRDDDLGRFIQMVPEEASYKDINWAVKISLPFESLIAPRIPPAPPEHRVAVLVSPRQLFFRPKTFSGSIFIAKELIHEVYIAAYTGILFPRLPLPKLFKCTSDQEVWLNCTSPFEQKLKAELSQERWLFNGALIIYERALGNEPRNIPKEPKISLKDRLADLRNRLAFPS